MAQEPVAGKGGKVGIHPHHEQIAAELQSFMDRVTGWSGQESLSQAIGRAAFEAGLEALLVPSHARPGRTNLVAFVQNLRTESSLRVLR